MGFGNFFGGIGSLLGGKKAFGSKPKYVSPETTTEEAISANLTLLPQITKLAELYNKSSQEAFSKQFESAAPGFSDYINELRDINVGLLHGKFPSAVQTEAERQADMTAGAYNFAHGTAGSAFGAGRFSLERGKIPLMAFETGINTAGQWANLARLHLAPSFNFSSYLVSPQTQYAARYQQSLVKAAPDPVTRGGLDTTMSVLGMVLGAYSGGPGYQNTYKPTYSAPPPNYAELYPQYGLPGGTTEGVNQGTGEGGMNAQSIFGFF